MKLPQKMTYADALNYCQSHDSALAWVWHSCSVSRIQKWGLELGWENDLWMGYASRNRQFAHQVSEIGAHCSNELLLTHP